MRSLVVVFAMLMSGVANANWEITANGQARIRYETINHQPSSNQQDHVVVSRLQGLITATNDNVSGVLEISDSRAFGYTAATPLGTDDVNALEPIQAKLAWHHHFDNQSVLTLQAGRFTMDIGSRRLVARNRFRNTLNTFDGLHATLQQGNWVFTGFHTYPVLREPDTRDALESGDASLDPFGHNNVFSGLHASYGDSSGQYESYLFRLSNDDNAEIRWTAGGRVLKAFDSALTAEAEVAWQWGETGRLHHDIEASLFHASLTYAADIPASPTVALLFDYASGDDHRTSKQEGFSTLFGARRFDYGPTGIYGLFARSNLLSPGVRITASPLPGITLMATGRLLYAAEGSDRSGRFSLVSGSDGTTRMGHQIEARVAWMASEHLHVDTGLAYASLTSNVDNVNRQYTYGYTQVSWLF